MKISHFLFSSIFFLFAFSLASENIALGSNENLIVSVENPEYDNHFSGTMVVEVVVFEPTLLDTDEGKGEPDVTLNGKQLRMVQAFDGSWYAYFANLDAAQTADELVLNAGASGASIDFGVFCNSDTATTVLGTSFSDSDGVAIPRSGGIVGATNGDATLSACTGSPTSSAVLNNVVKKPKGLNTNANVKTGQIGLDPDAWPLVQLFSFDDVVIQYNRAGSPQKVELQYDEIPNIGFSLDRLAYPTNAEVFLTLNDPQLNQDPTSRDSWTFNINTTRATFYNAFDESGADAANGGVGLIDLYSNLDNLGFEDNGILSLTLNNVVELRTNSNQPKSFVSSGTISYSQIVTLLESEPNSGIFESFDFGDRSTIGISGNAPRGNSDVLTYNSDSGSITTGSATASLSLGTSQIQPGQEVAVNLNDPDQNINPGARDDLDVFRSTAIIPSLTLGNPITLQQATEFQIYPLSTSNLVVDGTTILTSIPDTNSNRLIVDTTTTANTTFEKISINLGVTSNTLNNLFVDNSVVNNDGSNWINYDLRSFQKQLEINDFSDTEMILFFGLADATPITIVDAGDISSAQGFVKIDDTDIASIAAKSGTVFLVVDFDASDNSAPIATISSEPQTQPIIFDLFSFGTKGNSLVNNAIYRLELEETSSNSGTFEGTIEYFVVSESNPPTEQLASSLETISDKIQFLVEDRLIDDQGINIAYSDVSAVGKGTDIGSKSEINTHSGTVTSDSQNYRFGRPVTIILNDPDLNTDSNKIETFLTNNNPTSVNVDTVVTPSGDILLEVLIKDIRYQRCTVNGTVYGGLASTGFTLTETSPDSGIFEGIFKMPSQICDRTGSRLISPAGGNVDVKYHDFRDEFGEENIFSMSQFISEDTLEPKEPTVSEKREFGIPSWVKNNAKWWSENQIGDSDFTKGIEHLINQKIIDIPNLPQQSSVVAEQHVPDWIKNNAGWWANGQISDNDFTTGIKWLVENGIIQVR